LDSDLLHSSLPFFLNPFSEKWALPEGMAFLLSDSSPFSVGDLQIPSHSAIKVMGDALGGNWATSWNILFHLSSRQLFGGRFSPLHFRANPMDESIPLSDVFS
jgi:hypothetical protein